MNDIAEKSLAVWLSEQPADLRDKWLNSLTDKETSEMEYAWAFWARPEQLAPPGEYLTWLIMSGRGWGKTRTGAEWVRSNVHKYGRWALVGPTAGDVRDIMVEGDSGILSVFPPAERPHYQPSKRRVLFTNGAQAALYSADEPDRLRGPQHEAAWADEAASWRYLQDAWDMLQLGLRLGENPRQLVTTTPRPLRPIRELLASKSTVVTAGSTYANVMNLAPAFAAQIISRYEGTTLGRQEIYGELLNELPGALWSYAMIDSARVHVAPLTFKRIVVAVDPAVSSNAESDETGIAVAGLGEDGEYYILSCEGIRASPQTWAERALMLFRTNNADRIIVERNNGGEMVEATIKQVDKNAPVKTIYASRGKAVRAEPVAALYEQGKVHHVGYLKSLEDQQVLFPVASDLDDQVDAVVYCVTELMGQGEFNLQAPWGITRASPWRIS